MTTKFNTLNGALNSVNLVDAWPIGLSIDYDQTVKTIFADYLLISVYRDSNGKYEAPVFYSII